FLHPLSFLLHPRPPTFTLFPYTTLFRSPPNARPGSSARPARCRRRPSPAPSRRRPWCFPARRPTRRGGRTPSSSAISSRLLFAVHERLHEVALHDDDDHHRRQQRHDGRGHDQVPLGQLGARGNEPLNADDHHLHVAGRGHHQRPQVLLPAVDEVHHEQGRQV